MRIERQLLFNSSDHLGMTVAGVEHRNATGKVDKALAFNIPKFSVFGTRRENRRCT